MLLNRPHPGPGIQAELFSGFRTKSAIVSPSSGNFPMRNTYISAISYSTATSFRFLSPLVSEISNQPVDSNTLTLAVDAIFIWAPVYGIVARNLGTNVCRWQKKWNKGQCRQIPTKWALRKRCSRTHVLLIWRLKETKRKKGTRRNNDCRVCRGHRQGGATCKLFCVTSVTF